MPKKICLRPRLEAVAELLRGSESVADVGCDHGRLSVSLLQRGAARRVIASDVSAASLEKAAALKERCGIGDALTLVQAQGLAHLPSCPVQALAIAGMGGCMIVDILNAHPAVAKAADKLVLQPMGRAGVVREYLDVSGFRILDERIVVEDRRYYQIIAAQAGAPASKPKGWPKGFYRLGWLSLIQRDPLFLPLLDVYMNRHRRRLKLAKVHGVVPAALICALEDMETVRRIYLEDM